MTALLKPQDACRLLNVSRSWLYDACARGVVPHVRLGGSGGPLRFVEGELERWIAEHAARADVARGRGSAYAAPDNVKCPRDRWSGPGAWPKEG
jgi:excisionase family DNA binding protein